VVFRVLVIAWKARKERLSRDTGLARDGKILSSSVWEDSECVK